MKKLVIAISIFCSLFVLYGCKQSTYFVPLGNFSSNLVSIIEEKVGTKSRNYFTSQKMNSGELFKIADSNATYVEEDHKYTFISTIEKASYIMISLGIMDILPSLTIDEEKRIFDYDEELVEQQLEILDYHLVHIIDSIRYVTNKARIMIVGAFSTFEFEKPEEELFDSIITRINRVLLNACSDSKIEYVSTISIEERKSDEDFKANVDNYLADIIASHYE